MSNETALIVRNMDDAERAARAMAGSGFFQDTKQANQAIVKVLAGHELGFGPFASMTGVHIIQGKPTLASNLMAAAVKRNGKYNYRVIEASDAKCEIAWFEGGQEVGRSAFTWEEGTRAGLTNKDNWKKYPSDMLFARALSRGQRRFAPDIFNGATVYTPDEMGAVTDAEGNVIDAKATEVVTGGDNPDPIDEPAWQAWQALCQRADAVKIEHSNPDRNATTKTDLREAYAELLGFVNQAEAQAKEQ